MKQFDYSLDKLTEVLKDLAPFEECEHYYIIWQKFDSSGDKLLKRLDHFLLNHKENFPIVFNSLVAVNEEWFADNFKGKEHENYQNITPLVVALYDLILNLRRSYMCRSSMGASITLRVLFEIKVTLAEISKKPEPHSKQFMEFKNIQRILNEYQTNIITKDKFIEEIKKYPTWHDPNFNILKKKVKIWTAIEEDNLFKIACRNQLESDYKSLYKTTSAFVHASPLITNYYSVHGNGPISNPMGVFQLATLGIEVFLDCFELAFKIIDEDFSILKKVLKIPILIASSELGFS